MTSRQEAIANGSSRYFTGKPCVHGHVSFRRAKTGECLECRKLALALWRKANPSMVKAHNDSQYKIHGEKIKANRTAYVKANPEAKRISDKKYYEANKPKYRHVRAKRRAAERQRTPAWLTSDDYWMVEEAYSLAALRTKMFGFRWDVDHVVPLLGKNVSGLHVPNNLQVISAKHNRSKSNKYKVS